MAKVKVKVENQSGKDISFKWNLGSTYVNAGQSKEVTIEAGNVQATYNGKKIWESSVSDSSEGSTIIIH